MLKGKALFSTTIMRAIVVSNFGDPNVLQLRRDAPIPKPNAKQVLVKVSAVGVNPVEAYIRAGIYNRLPKLPYVPGSDVSGTVVFVGAEVKGFKEGDLVCSFRSVSGSYAEFSVIAPEHLIKLPDGYNLIKAAAIGVPYVTAYRALFTKGHTKPGERVLVHGGSGGVGIAACQFALSRGCIVYGTAGTEEGMELLRSMGVEYVYNHRSEGYINEIKKESDGIDVVIEMLSNVNLGKDLTLLRKKGRVMVVGCRGPVEINPRALMSNEATILGVALASATLEELHEASAMIYKMLVTGEANPVIGRTHSLNNAKQAHEDIIHQFGANGKMVLIL